MQFPNRNKQGPSKALGIVLLIFLQATLIGCEDTFKSVTSNSSDQASETDNPSSTTTTSSSTSTTVSSTTTTTSTTTSTTLPQSGDLNVYMHVDWSTATGNSVDAIYDTDKEPYTFGFGSGFMSSVYESDCPPFSVHNTASEGRAFPTENFLRLKAQETCNGAPQPIGDGWAQLEFNEQSNILPVINVGEGLFVRYYIRVMYPYHNLDTTTHGDEWADFGYPYGLGYGIGATHWRTGVWVSTSPIGQFCSSPDSPFPTYNLEKNKVYRIEHGVVRVVGGFQIKFRIYDENDQLVQDTGDFVNNCYGGPTAGAKLSDITWPDTPEMWGSFARKFHIGLNGINDLSSSNEGQDVFEWGAFAICDDWCGAYPIPGVE